MLNEAERERARTARRRTAAWSALLCLALLALPAGCRQKKLTEVRFDSPSAKDCGKCHVEVYEEWHGSAHARAWTSPRFRETTADYSIGGCLPCHAPLSIFTGGRPPALRGTRREEGVTCITCHLEQGLITGPMKVAPMTPHATAGGNALFNDASLCGTCHIGTYEEWLAHRDVDRERRTCQQCHMAPVRRKMTQATGMLSQAIVALHEERDLKRHGFDLRSMAGFEGEVGMTISPAPGPPVVLVRNNLPHAVPTGRYGYRHARLTAELLDAEGRVLGEQARDLFLDLQTALEPGAETPWALAPLDGVAAVRVRLERLDRAGRPLLLIAEGRLPLDGGRGGEEAAR